MKCPDCKSENLLASQSRFLEFILVGGAWLRVASKIDTGADIFCRDCGNSWHDPDFPEKISVPFPKKLHQMEAEKRGEK